MYDIAIIGLGPAGATWHVSGQQFFCCGNRQENADGSGFQKPCGGLLAKDAQKPFPVLTSLCQKMSL